NLKEIVGLFKQVHQPPEDPRTQLEKAIGAVFTSWNNPRAQTYRKLNELPDNAGTAVIIQAMVFGNMGQSSGSGVVFTRNPANGNKECYGEFLMNAEGEDMTSGSLIPRSLEEFKEESPTLFNQLFQLQKTLEQHYRDMQDLEFTIQENRLYLLQTRSGKRTAKAAVKIAVDLVQEGQISEKEALRRLEPEMAGFFMHPMIDPEAKKKVLARGLPASPGAVTGKIVFSPEDAQKAKEKDEAVILVRVETTLEDIHGMKAALGVLTSSGGMTSHAAVVARGMGRTCIVGCESISVDEKKQQLILEDGSVLCKGQLLTLDGSSGEVMEGRVPTIDTSEDQDFLTILSWADKYRRLKIRTNVETAKEAQKARQLGAEGIGLCRTENMFFGKERIHVMREMILAQTRGELQKKLERLSSFQISDLKKLFQVMDGLPVTIRLLDTPLQEFFPTSKTEIEALAEKCGYESGAILRQIEELHEINPVLGFRGCRLSIVYPEIAAMQMDAVLTAAIQSQQNGLNVLPEIMIPLVATSGELEVILQGLEQTAQQTFHRLGERIAYKIGTMMEVPRACVQSRTVAPQVQFMSFGTNDLTQTTFGLSREDMGKFLPNYLEHKILPFNPFISLDQQGVGNLIRMALEQSRKVQKKMKYGICGEHAGDPRSIMFFHRIGMDYVSCSPHRIPAARIAAAKASI
ncbi:MAG TPA: pyruvate, phosphate dikinase, partial [Deltaproteobacteria bacterium]|nr:pyruvate, phosphate dikinase [Deltaproteobacteria bacterium]